MDKLLQFLTSHGPAIGTLGAAVAFVVALVWSVVRFLSVRGRAAKAREFDMFHKLIKELVEPPSNNAPLYVDRQAAVLFELRFFSRYHPLIRRMLIALNTKWSTVADASPRVLEELRITLDFIEKQSNAPHRRLARWLRLSRHWNSDPIRAKPSRSPSKKVAR